MTDATIAAKKIAALTRRVTEAWPSNEHVVYLPEACPPVIVESRPLGVIYQRASHYRSAPTASDGMMEWLIDSQLVIIGRLSPTDDWFVYCTDIRFDFAADKDRLYNEWAFMTNGIPVFDTSTVDPSTTAYELTEDGRLVDGPLLPADTTQVHPPPLVSAPAPEWKVEKIDHLGFTVDERAVSAPDEEAAITLARAAMGSPQSGGFRASLVAAGFTATDVGDEVARRASTSYAAAPPIDCLESDPALAHERFVDLVDLSQVQGTNLPPGTTIELPDGRRWERLDGVYAPGKPDWAVSIPSPLGFDGWGARAQMGMSDKDMAHNLLHVIDSNLPRTDPEDDGGRYGDAD